MLGDEAVDYPEKGWERYQSEVTPVPPQKQ